MHYSYYDDLSQEKSVSAIVSSQNLQLHRSKINVNGL